MDENCNSLDCALPEIGYLVASIVTYETLA